MDCPGALNIDDSLVGGLKRLDDFSGEPNDEVSL